MAKLMFQECIYAVSSAFFLFWLCLFWSTHNLQVFWGMGHFSRADIVRKHHVQKLGT